MKATITIEFNDQHRFSKNYDDYLARKDWFSKEESACLVKNSISNIKDAIRLGYRSGNINALAEIDARRDSRPYFGTWKLEIIDDEED